MSLASCIENYAGPGARGEHGVVTFAEGGVRFALYLSSLVSVFRRLSFSTRLSLRTVPALRAYIMPTMLADETYALQGLITWKDMYRSLSTMYAPLGSREVVCVTKTSTVQAAHLVFRQVLLSVVGQLIAPHPGTDAVTIPIRAPITPPEQAEESSIPRIVVTPPAASSLVAPLNTVPTPQDAAFGNRLTVPDPEFTVINCWRSPENPFADTFSVDESGSDTYAPFGGFGGCPSPSWGDPEASHDVLNSASREDEEEDAGALGLGPTWSG